MAAHALQMKVKDTVGEIPFIVVFNKSDLNKRWEKQEREIARMEDDGWVVKYTSAKTGTGVEDVFLTLTEMILNPRPRVPTE